MEESDSNREGKWSFPSGTERVTFFRELSAFVSFAAGAERINELSKTRDTLGLHARIEHESPRNDDPFPMQKIFSR